MLFKWSFAENLGMKIYYRLTKVFIGCICYMSSQAQSPVNSGNEAITHRLDEYLIAANRLFQFNGTALVAKQGVILLNKGYGWRDAELKTRNNSNSIYHLGSITKSFTGAAILKLQEEGKLSLHDKLVKYLPEYAIGAEITIDNLLRHQSGIYDLKYDSSFYRSENAEGTRPMSKERVFSLFKNKPLAFEPGTKTEYSNTGYIIAGWIIEKVTGKPYEQVIREWFFESLNMKHSGFDFIKLKSPDKATGYAVLNNKIQRTIAPLDSTAAYAAGGMYSTAEDLYKWSRAILHTHSLLSKRSWRLSYTLPSKKVQFGLGWHIAFDDGKRYIMQYGNIRGFGSYYWQGLDDDIVIILLCNQDSQSELTDLEPALMNVWKIVKGLPYATPKDTSEVHVNETALKSYTGTYTGNNLEVIITYKDGRLYAESPKGSLGLSPMYAAGETRFFLRIVDISFEFVPDKEGKVTKMIVVQDGQSFEFEKVK